VVVYDHHGCVRPQFGAGGALGDLRTTTPVEMVVQEIQTIG
jgi:hypothetical protein